MCLYLLILFYVFHFKLCSRVRRGKLAISFIYIPYFDIFFVFFMEILVYFSYYYYFCRRFL